MEKRHLKHIRKCDGCATRKACFVYYAGRYSLDCAAWVKEGKTKSVKKSTSVFVR